MSKGRMVGSRMVRPKASATVHELRMTLLEIEPEIWRRVAVPSIYSLAKLHRVIQMLFGWQDYHLFSFKLNGDSYEILMEHLDQEPGIRDARMARLGDLVPNAGVDFTYDYDFGDSWQIGIGVIDVRPAGEDERYPACLDGARSGPPEDSGGVPGYMDLLDAFAHPKRKSSGELLEWAGPSFDPDDFNVDFMNRRLKMFGLTGLPWPDRLK